MYRREGPGGDFWVGNLEFVSDFVLLVASNMGPISKGERVLVLKDSNIWETLI